ncbi:MAG: TonB-dependent receptor plug domain-containing protein, partial [Gloeobacteraceae cyanobacterium ES-bin-144]|nr:TonB-dependent receptor plug domain-containing protein [Verrucomicrobiales bacterium]
MPPSLRLSNSPWNQIRRVQTIVWVGLAWFMVSAAPAAVIASLADLSMEQLMNESVTSVSKKQTKLSDAAAAISIVTADDIERLGITTIPEALRLVPGLDVAQMDASRWAISSRGFNFGYANKLLVLMDGRSLYSPAFGGVQWGLQDMMLEDLDRIEVIRGPGATLWGANAVNGVINITSKSSKDTQGMLVSTALGSDEQPLTSIRYGGEVNPQLHYRMYLKYFNRDDFSLQSGGSAGDGWDGMRGGFRTDWEASVRDLVTLQGDFYSMASGENVTLPQFTPPFSTDQKVNSDSYGGNLLGRWTRTLSETSHLSLQAYFDYFRTYNGLTRETRRTGDIEGEYRFAVGSRHDLIWGMGYRFTTDDFNSTPITTWDPASRDLHLFNTFLQDEITLIPDRLRFTLGSKLEHNDYTGWEIQPSARLLWTPHKQHSVWASVSHAVANPTRASREGTVVGIVFHRDPAGLPFQSALVGNDNLVSEELDAFELGYRVEVTPELSFDLATFYNKYDNLVGVIRGS